MELGSVQLISVVARQLSYFDVGARLSKLMSTIK